MYKIVSSNSKGNAVIYHNSILVDCGVPFSHLKPYLYDIQIVLLTHKHNDHFNVKTLCKLLDERPTLRIGCPNHMGKSLESVRSKNIDFYNIGSIYDYGIFKVSPVKLYHDVPNCGYRIFKDDYKIFHATDTAHLNGIEAKNYDLYAIEHNYDEETIEETIRIKREKGQFSYEKGAINTHLSEQQARDFIYNNKGENYQILRLHE
jgi:L-ascorbate metabolism protein UlaG (beta-lactamase superfamily)